jgi:hypothetical protein
MSFFGVFLTKMTDFKTCALNQMPLLASYFEENNCQIVLSFLFDQKRLIKAIKHDFLKRPLNMRIFKLFLGYFWTNFIRKISKAFYFG